MITATGGWRIHLDDQDICASLWTKEAGDIFTVKGFSSRLEVCMFIATYFTLMLQSRESEATKLIREFSSRVAH